MPIRCVIFDLDGTMVDSEALCGQAWLDLIQRLDESADAFALKYQGMKFSHILEDMEARTDRRFGSAFEAEYRARVSELFEAHLKPVHGVIDLLETLRLPICIASNGPRSKIELALRVTELSRFFGDQYFSAYEARVWKPAPGLFLQSARVMGFEPSNCAVVEDSEVGVRAACAAGMAAFQYVPIPKALAQCHGPAVVFSAMAQLPQLLSQAGALKSPAGSDIEGLLPMPK